MRPTDKIRMFALSIASTVLCAPGVAFAHPGHPAPPSSAGHVWAHALPVILVIGALSLGLLWWTRREAGREGRSERGDRRG